MCGKRPYFRICSFSAASSILEVLSTNMAHMSLDRHVGKLLAQLDWFAEVHTCETVISSYKCTIHCCLQSCLGEGVIVNCFICLNDPVRAMRINSCHIYPPAQNECNIVIWSDFPFQYFHNSI